MLISSTKAWSTGFLSRTNIFVCIFTFPLVLLASYFIAVPLLQSDGNLSEALIILSDEKASVRGRYVPSPLGILITIGLLFIPIILTKLGRFVGRNTKFGIFNANNIVDVEPKYSGLEKKGALTIKGKQGTARLIGPYIEVFLNDQYVAGLMGDEGVRLILPPNDYQVSLRLSSFTDSKQATNANLILTKNGGPLREEIKARKLKPTKNYRFSFPVM